MPVEVSELGLNDLQRKSDCTKGVHKYVKLIKTRENTHVSEFTRVKPLSLPESVFSFAKLDAKDVPKGESETTKYVVCRDTHEVLVCTFCEKVFDPFADQKG